jgi:hypothetical protein
VIAEMDKERTSESYVTNEGVDRLLVTYNGTLEGVARLYAGDNDLRDPMISAVYRDLNGFRPGSEHRAIIYRVKIGGVKNETPARA